MEALEEGQTDLQSLEFQETMWERFSKLTEADLVQADELADEAEELVTKINISERSPDNDVRLKRLSEVRSQLELLGIYSTVSWSISIPLDSNDPAVDAKHASTVNFWQPKEPSIY